MYFSFYFNFLKKKQKHFLASKILRNYKFFSWLQNVWHYSDSVIYLEEREKDLPEYLIIYLKWNEDIIFERWDYSELPGCFFVLRKIKEQKRLFNPGTCCNEESYMNFLKGVRKVYRNSLEKPALENLPLKN